MVFQFPYDYKMNSFHGFLGWFLKYFRTNVNTYFFCSSRIARFLQKTNITYIWIQPKISESSIDLFILSEYFHFILMILKLVQEQQYLQNSSKSIVMMKIIFRWNIVIHFIKIKLKLLMEVLCKGTDNIHLFRKLKLCISVVNLILLYKIEMRVIFMRFNSMIQSKIIK